MKKILAILLAVCLLSGCQLATTEQAESELDDKLVGLFVTFEYLDMGFDPLGESEPRLYGELTEDGWSFPGYEGVSMIQVWDGDHWNGIMTEGFCDMKTHVNSSDTHDGIEEEGTLYVPEGVELMFHANPVYMTPEGEYYATAAMGMCGSAGAMSESVREETTWTMNGEEKTYSAKFTVSVEWIQPADRVVLVQMSADNRELARAEYAPGELPESLTPVDGAAYVIAERRVGETVDRTIHQPGGEKITVYYADGQIYCLPRFTEILWND